ncbi:uncharacterized protein LOC114360111 isoform X2 [Ostrinia furnacalis]|uniref:uncharacterized protein LOC114360111 isoform X2 n=1 Tax=Ostrinia furnacalis TaxID=93504 RepID=UPI0010386377|nr:uncharacterized protein LOC114360111 isoform X2 [Ostrinia furnacalis]
MIFYIIIWTIDLAAVHSAVLKASRNDLSYNIWKDKLASDSTHKRTLNGNTDNDYDYEHLLDEYYEESLNESKENKSYRIFGKDAESSFANNMRKFMNIKNKNCSQEDIGINAIKCLFVDYYNRKQPLNVFVGRLWTIIRVWFILYIVLAIPLWCMKGLCCCCFFCRIFKPHQTIAEAKSYFITNPPGLLKTTKGHEVLYEPTKNERDAYEEFEHLIRTI